MKLKRKLAPDPSLEDLDDIDGPVNDEWVQQVQAMNKPDLVGNLGKLKELLIQKSITRQPILPAKFKVGSRVDAKRGYHWVPGTVVALKEFSPYVIGLRQPKHAPRILHYQIETDDGDKAFWQEGSVRTIRVKKTKDE